ncbi:hypothetical protein K440DRAFT_630806 [Wilcoxina mikolae CBS 423.85]|nr:hypothetical protein K440DRAFT_630806 [Wilcoxina mikolae CBS 423.85]
MPSPSVSPSAITTSTASYEHLKTPPRQLPPKAATDPLANRPRLIPSHLSLPTFLLSTPGLTSATLSNNPRSYSPEEDSLPSANLGKDTKPDPELEKYEDLQLLVDRQLEAETRYGFSNTQYPDGPLTHWPRLSSCSPGPPPGLCTPRRRVSVAPCGSPNLPEAEEVEIPFVWGRRYSPSYSRQATPYREVTPYSDPEHYTHQKTPFPEDTPHSVRYRREETTDTDGYSSFGEAYLRTPNPRKPRHFSNEWDPIPTSQMLWCPPSRNGVRRSERLRNLYSPLMEKQSRINKIFNFFAPTPLKVIITVVFAILLALYSRTTVAYAILPIHCLLDPLCTSWHASRTQTTHFLLSHTTRHSTALLTFQNATSTYFLPIPQTLSTLAANLHTEATIQQRLARTRDEITNADSLFTFAQEVVSTQRFLQETQTSLDSTISLSISSLFRFSGYLLHQNPSIPRPATSWERGVPRTTVARESTIRRNFAGHVATLRVLCGAMDHELFRAQKRVEGAIRVLEERKALHRNAFFLLRQVVRVLEGLRMVELRAFGLALVERGEEIEEEEGEALGWKFEAFYGVLEVLEGKSERSYRLAPPDVVDEGLGARLEIGEGEDGVEPEVTEMVDGKLGQDDFGRPTEQGEKILKAEPAKGVEGFEVRATANDGSAEL